jgi:hypothetical protein
MGGCDLVGGRRQGFTFGCVLPLAAHRTFWFAIDHAPFYAGWLWLVRVETAGVSPDYHLDMDVGLGLTKVIVNAFHPLRDDAVAGNLNNIA